MRIDSFAASQADGLSSTTAQGSSNTPAASVSTPTVEDKTTLLSGSDSIASMTTQAMQSGAARLDKVTALQQAVSSGDYQLEPAKIANAMISNN